MRLRRPERRCGLALIIVVGVLSVLAVVATAFVMMAELERKASQQRMLSVKAYLLARSGIEDALARLEMGQDPDASWNRYLGEDHNANNALDGLEVPAEVFHAGALDTSGCPLRHALRPGFYVQDAASLSIPKDPALRAVDGRSRGYSGVLRGDHADLGNTYALKVSGGGFHVNGGDPAAGAAVGYNAVLRRILGTLAEAIDREDGVDDASPADQVDGEALINLRPNPQGWSNFQEIKSVALGGNQAKLDALKPYLTLTAWVDRHVIQPNVEQGVIPSPLPKNYTSWGALRLDRKAHPTDASSKEPPLEVTGRAPVELAWARTRRPALVAVLAELKGLYLDETTAKGIWDPLGPPYDLIGTLREAEIANTWIATDDCHTAVSTILNFAGPLDTWQDFGALCDTVPFTGPADVAQAKRDILKANLNPNTDLNKFNPSRSLWKSVDKSDLLVRSTEFSLFPVSPRTVESLGWVAGRGGRLLALRSLRAVLPGPSVARLTTQREFACADLGGLDAAGDETGVRLPGDSPFLGLSQGTSVTWGSGRSGTPLAGKGTALQTYPEPCYDTTPVDAAGLAMSPADYDGNLQLATTETSADQWYSVGAATKNMMLLARFDDGFDLDVGDAYPVILDGKDCQEDAQLVAPGELTNRLWHVSKPNTLYPDGAYSERDRAPAWFDKGNANGLHGLMSFWVKANHRDQGSRYRRYVHWTNYETGVPGAASPDQFFAAVYYGGNYAFHFENAHLSDNNREHSFRSTRGLEPRRWLLFTYYYNLEAADGDPTGDLFLDDGAAAQDQALLDSYSKGNAEKDAIDFTLDDLYGRHKITLGKQAGLPLEAYVGSYCGGGADATFDEFATYDFGTDESSAAKLATNRYKDGRYYKGALYTPPAAALANGQAGTFITAPISLPSGSLLLKVFWTWWKPGDPVLAADYAEVEIVNTAASAQLWAGSRSGNQASQAWTVNKTVPGSFRARVIFTRDGATVADPDGSSVGGTTPLLDSPVFDDLTFVYQVRGAVSLTGWQEAE